MAKRFSSKKNELKRQAESRDTSKACYSSTKILVAEFSFVNALSFIAVGARIGTAFRYIHSNIEYSFGSLIRLITRADYGVHQKPRWQRQPALLIRPRREGQGSSSEKKPGPFVDKADLNVGFRRRLRRNGIHMQGGISSHEKGSPFYFRKFGVKRVAVTYTK